MEAKMEADDEISSAELHRNLRHPYDGVKGVVGLYHQARDS